MLVRLPLIFLIIILLLTTANASYYPDLRYTKISYTTEDHELCMTDCIHGECALWATYTYHAANCIAGDELAPIYYTAQYRQDKSKKCLSRCGFYGYKYEWCYIDNNEYWDYCSSQILPKLIQGQETLDGSPCVDQCVKEWDMYTCTDTNGIMRECDQRNVTIRQGSTIYGEQCIGECKKYKDKHYYMCSKNGEEEYCALSAQPRMSEIFKTLSIEDCERGRLAECGFKKTVDIIEKAPYFETFKDDEANNTVKQYTIQHGDERVGSRYNLLPLVIRATVTKQTLLDNVTFPDISLSDLYRNLQPMKKRDGDVPVSLISYRMGGRNETYNVIPVHASVKEKIGVLQNVICDVFLGEHEEAAEVTVLVTYTRDKKVDAVIYNIDHYSLDLLKHMNYLVYFHNKDE